METTFLKYKKSWWRSDSRAWGNTSSNRSVVIIYTRLAFLLLLLCHTNFQRLSDRHNINRQMEILLLDGMCVRVFATGDVEYNKIISFMHIYFTFLQQPKPFPPTIDTTFSMWVCFFSAFRKYFVSTLLLCVAMAFGPLQFSFACWLVFVALLHSPSSLSSM